MARYAMLVDLDRCIGCRACMEACKVENNTPEGAFWMYVFRFEEGEYPDARVSFMPRPCMHCDNAPCVKVCPVGARYKREDGIVATDWDRCIGCRYCEVACPYGVNYFNWRNPEKSYYQDWDQEVAAGTVPPYQNPDLAARYGPEKRHTAGGGQQRGVIEKCTWCIQRVENDQQPACVSNCPQYALQFSDLDDPNPWFAQRWKEKTHFRLLEEAGTDPRVYYLGGRPPSAKTKQIEPVKARV